MSDQENHVLLTEEFGRYRPTAIMQVEVPGPAAVRRSVRARRRRTVSGGIVAAIALLTGPAVGYAVAGHNPAPPPGPVQPTGSATPTPTPSLSASPTPTAPATSAAAAPPPPDGYLTRSQLMAGPLTVPSFRSSSPKCPSGRIRLDTSGTGLNVFPVSVDHADVDRDGAAETVVRLRCLVEGAGPEQVVVYDRDAAGGIVALGQVIAVPGTTEAGSLETLEVRSDGQIRLQLTDLASDTGWPPQWAQHQWRTFRWNGSGFEQVAGESSFPTNPYSVDLSVTTTPVHMTKNTDGSGTYSGSIDVRIRHLGGRDATGVELRLNLQMGLFPVDNSWTSCRPGYRTSRDPTVCRLGALRSGDEITLRLPLQVPQGTPYRGEKGLVAVTALGPQDQALIERDQDNNQVNTWFG
ncbi:hypothetical protein ACFY3U_21845 [Micromonospora sp. NPDC000089]|uniref:hypothetical protein n=1 Tax=unclassified Micromonospora TaxID=2617518 RepID=UPI0036C13268